MLEHPMLEKVVSWANGEDDIRAVVVTGSLARGDGSTDEFSDLDVQIIATDYARYIADDSWLDKLGEVWIQFPLYEDVPYRLVWFADGTKVDFQFMTVEIIESRRLSDEYLRGYLVALDKDDFYHNLQPSPRIFPQPANPGAEQVEAVINEFWFEAIHVAQFIRRREFWVVKFRDWTMKCDLLQLLEWHARATSEEPVNTWLLGKRMREWTDATSYDSVREIWSGWEAKALWHALRKQIELFDRLSSELSVALGFRYDANIYRKIDNYISELQAADDLA